jgi:hypothetical protein
MSHKILEKKRSTIENGNFFIEYFYSLGLNHELILDDLLYNTDIKILNEHRKINPSIISKYPDIEKPYIGLEEQTLIKVNNINLNI